MSIPPFTRRRFLSNLTLAAPASSPVVRAMTALSATQLAFVGIDAPEGPELDRIEVYRVNNHHWQLSSSTSAAAPHAIVLHPTLPILYVVHSIAEHQHRPRGAISAFRIDTVAASLSPLSHEPLTLAATLPNRIAIAPDGNRLIVASTTTGIFNLFQLHSDGALISYPSPLKLPSLATSQLTIAFNTSSSAIVITTSRRTEHLVIQADSSLARSLTIKPSPKDAAPRISLGATIKRELAAQHAASIVMLTV